MATLDPRVRRSMDIMAERLAEPLSVERLGQAVGPWRDAAAARDGASATGDVP